MRKTNLNHRLRPSASHAAVLALLGTFGSAQAFSIDSADPDIAMRLDTTVRYNFAVRANEPGAVGNNFQFDESDYKFGGRGDIVTNRIDLLPEFDFVYRKRFGFRISASGWYDNAYSDTSTSRNPALVGGTSASAYTNNEYRDYTQRYYRGPSGEFLDAFVFAGVDLGDMPLTVKAGKHTTSGANHSSPPPTASPTARARWIWPRLLPRRALNRRSCSARSTRCRRSWGCRTR